MPADHDTYHRSLAHWSEDGRAEMEAFYALARQDYRYLARSVDWTRVFALLRERRGGTRELRLLDVACGSGKFPEALLDLGPLPALEGVEIRYGLLDPSPFSISEARSVLRAPFSPAEELETRVQDLDRVGEYDVAWATHALYAVPPADLEEGVRRMMRALRPDGVAFFGHASRDSHYLRFYEHFLRDFRDGRGTPFSSSEQVMAALEAVGVAHARLTVEYVARVAAEREQVLEGYLQRCAFDSTVSVADLLDGDTTGPYLRSLHDGESGDYRFPQRVDLVFAGLPEAVVSSLHRSYRE